MFWGVKLSPTNSQLTGSGLLTKCGIVRGTSSSSAVKERSIDILVEDTEDETVGGSYARSTVNSGAASQCDRVSGAMMAEPEPGINNNSRLRLEWDAE